MSSTQTIPKKMHAAVLKEYKKPFAYEEVPVPEVGPNDVLVQVKAAGLCHTDIQVSEGESSHRVAAQSACLRSPTGMYAHH